MKILTTACLLCFLLACTQEQEKKSESTPEDVQQEIRDVEKAFAEMTAKEGIAAAFTHYAADDVVLSRGKKLIRGKDELRQFYAGQTFEDVKLFWEPTYVDVSASGDLAYTYGPYTFSARDTAGNMVLDTGYFHTVWKKQPDGEWKFVWD